MYQKSAVIFTTASISLQIYTQKRNDVTLAIRFLLTPCVNHF